MTTHPQTHVSRSWHRKGHNIDDSEDKDESESNKVGSEHIVNRWRVTMENGIKKG